MSNMKHYKFFSTHPVFRYEEFVVHCSGESSRKISTVDSLLTYHMKAGTLRRLRRGLFAIIPHGTDPADMQIDPYVIAGKLASDAVLGYHTALSFLGKAYAPRKQFYVLTHNLIQGFKFDDYEVIRVANPVSLIRADKEHFGVVSHERMGVTIRVTSLERTFVDVLGKMELGGGWGELRQSLGAIDYLNLDEVVEYALLLRNATTMAKVGYYLESNRERLLVTDKSLETLCAHRPRSPQYLERRQNHKNYHFINRWNILIPEGLFV